MHFGGDKEQVKFRRAELPLESKQISLGGSSWVQRNTTHIRNSQAL